MEEAESTELFFWSDCIGDLDIAPTHYYRYAFKEVGYDTKCNLLIPKKFTNLLKFNEIGNNRVFSILSRQYSSIFVS